jgi:hypothetical protein
MKWINLKTLTSADGQVVWGQPEGKLQDWLHTQQNYREISFNIYVKKNKAMAFVLTQSEQIY